MWTQSQKHGEKGMKMQKRNGMEKLNLLRAELQHLHLN